MIKLTEKTHMVGMWNITFFNGREWMAAICREDPTDDWTVTFRFRYQAGKQYGDPFRDEDKKSWYMATKPANTDPGQLYDDMTRIADEMFTKFGGKHREYLRIDGGYTEFLKAAASSTYINLKYSDSEDEDSSQPDKLTTAKAASA